MSDGSIVISTKINQSGMNKGISQIKSGLSGLTSSLKGLAAAAGIAFSTAAIIKFGAESVKESAQLSNAMRGLKSIVEGQGRSFSNAQGFINDYVSDGLVPLTSAVTAYKNLAMRGYSDDQIQKTMTSLKDSAAFGRQASLSMGDAITSATEGLKNENSILVDNAGVTKNVSVMWKEYAKSIGVGVDSLTKEQKIQAEVNGIMTETRFQTGDAAKVADSYSGQVSQLSFNFSRLKVAIGNLIIPIATKVLPAINNAIKAATQFAKAMSSALGFDTSSAESSQEQLVENQDEVTDAINKTTEANKKALASFDELNVRDQSSTESAAVSADVQPTVASSNDGGTEDASKYEKMADRIKTAIDKIKDAFNDLMDNPIVVWLREKLSEALSIESDRFAKMKEWIDDNKDSIDKINEKLETLRDKLWKATEPMLNNAWEKFKQILEKIDGVLYSLRDASIYLQLKLLDLVIAVYDFLDKIGAIDFITSIVQNVINFIGGIISDALTWLSEQIDSLKLILGGIIDFITGILTGDFDKALGGLGDIFTGFKDSISSTANLFGNIFNRVATFASDSFENVKTFVSNIASNIWAFICDLPKNIGKALGFVLGKLVSWGIDAVAWVKNKVPEIINGIVDFFLSLPQKIKDVFNNIISFLNKLPSKMLDIGKNMISGIWNGIKAAKDWLVDKVSGFFGGLADGFLEGIGFGGDSSSPEQIVDVPKLATGAVIPPNAEFAAILGDQKRGRNLEAPENLIRQIVREESGRSEGTDNAGIISAINALRQTLVDKKLIDSPEQFARDYNKYFDAESNRSGSFAAIGGVR